MRPSHHYLGQFTNLGKQLVYRLLRRADDVPTYISASEGGFPIVYVLDNPPQGLFPCVPIRWVGRATIAEVVIPNDMPTIAVLSK